MKTKQFITACIILTGMIYNAQEIVKKQSLGLINIDTKNLNIDPTSMGNMVRTEIERLDTFDVRDKYDIQQFMEQNKLELNNCFGKTCLTEVGQKLKCDKMLTGAVELLGKNIVFTYRLLDTKTGYVEKTYVHEFLDITEAIQDMAKLSVADMMGRAYDKNLMNKLSKQFEFDNSNNNPTVSRLRLDGPRMGFVYFTGNLSQTIMKKKTEGGFDAVPVMFQFGYQFEKQYLNEGKVQALFEFIPMVTGLDQGLFIPSITLMHGLRSNINGWEFAFGPTFHLLPMASGYFDQNSDWHLAKDWDNQKNGSNPFESKVRIDSRGDYSLQSAFILAAGRTFKSGRLNIPVNAYFVPGRDGWRVGVSFGFNARNDCRR
jgi:hypothetical protein